MNQEIKTTTLPYGDRMRVALEYAESIQNTAYGTEASRKVGFINTISYKNGESWHEVRKDDNLAELYNTLKEQAKKITNLKRQITRLKKAQETGS